ncbi:DUF4132 domain-containing protein [Chitinophaga solisilvae]|uniref:DUF4132 domain-containing protein n=1 Tax=Chitinophaga solisilvae TaxID=1233460 RepID=UPI0013700F85|nr:DUF4132 domain-containing protein [Chitinophaga solisilvae]
MDVNEFLQSREKPQYVEQMTATMMAVFKGGSAHDQLTAATAEIVLLLLDALQQQPGNEHRFMAAISYKDERYTRLETLLGGKSWDEPEYHRLLIFIFGETVMPYVKYAWEKVRYRMYLHGYMRRSFCAPHDPEVYFVNQLNFLRIAILQSFVSRYYPDKKITQYDLTFTEQLRYHHSFQSDGLYPVWAAAIDMDNEEVFTAAENIIFNKDPEGKVTRNLIKALLTSEKPAAWQLVEKLLLAAQRQEGLRQTILESLDETSTGALKYMIRVILEHKLTRFSSVIRAVDVWAGLGWEAEKENTIRQLLEKAAEYLEAPEKIQAAVSSKHNAEVYMALWAQGVYDVAATRPLLLELQQKGNAEKRCLALKFAAETQYYNVDMPLAVNALHDEDLAVNALALGIVNRQLTSAAAQHNQWFPELFPTLHTLVQRAPEKEKVFEGVVFSWMHVTFDRNHALSAMMQLILDQQDRLDILLGYFDEMSLPLREQLARQLLPGYSPYSWQQQSAPEPLSAFQRNFALRLLKDRGEYVVNTAFNALGKEQFTIGELDIFTDMLKRKGAGVRSKSIDLILKQQDEVVLSATEKLLNGDTEQRLAGLDIALRLRKANRLTATLQTFITTFSERKNISQKEEILLSQLVGENSQLQTYTAENGYGCYDPAAVPQAVLPAVQEGDYYGTCLAAGPYGCSRSLPEIQEALMALYRLFEENCSYEYEVENYNNSKEAILLGSSFRNKKAYGYKFASVLEEYANYPLPEVWEKWYQESGLTPRDLFILNTLLKDKSERSDERFTALATDYLPVMQEVIPKEVMAKYPNKWYNPLLKIIQALVPVHTFDRRNEFLLGACTRVYQALPPEVLGYNGKGGTYYNNEIGWQALSWHNTFLHLLVIQELEGDALALAWNLYHWRQFSGLPQYAHLYNPPLLLCCKAFQAGLIGEGEMYRCLISIENMRTLSGSIKRKKDQFDYFTAFPFLELMFSRVREHFLDIELKRGDSATAVTHFVQVLQTVYGISRFGEIWAGLGKTTLHRGYIYSYSDTAFSKQQLLSTLLKRCFPLPDDTQEQFNAAVKKIRMTEPQLIEAAVYAPQWQPFISQYLGWKGLDAAIWWMHAHTKSSGTEQNAEAESEIARYSAVDLQDFKDGAVDKEWFNTAMKELGKARWQIVYDAAKYISDGNAHRRARLYADVMTGILKIKEVTQKVKEKRDQDYLRLYGLIPLSKANADKDVLSRYEYLQQFKKESKQFGAQKQSSESLALRIAMENLARNAGYADPVRLTWAMETRQVQSILSKETQVQFDDTIIGLIIDEEGQADVVAFKGDKQLKSIPPKYKNDKKVLELAEYRKTLREQFRRSRKALEDAMVRGDVFSFAEMTTLFSHPVIAKHLQHLVFITEKGHGFYSAESLCDANGNLTPASPQDTFRIAHCSDLHRNQSWSAYQRYCFEKKIQQPFRQVFRELYVPLAEELKEKSVSRRYAGHQVQPAQTVALLRGRGWKVDYEEGLQKVFHRDGFVAKIYAQANWFSPGEIESPTLETIIFHDLKNYKQVAFSSISPLIFSEVMRDLDLVVSVAHVGGVDPEASHSSVEMRQVLLEETCRLFRLKNVRVEGTHALINGKYGEYSVHLGSAVVHQLPGKYLSVLPVHSQHRGRIFLPFADDDPKSAELISKVLMLARDHEIQDPTILQQLS